MPRLLHRRTPPKSISGGRRMGDWVEAERQLRKRHPKNLLKGCRPLDLPAVRSRHRSLIRKCKSNGSRNFSLAWRFGFFTFRHPRMMGRALTHCRPHRGGILIMFARHPKARSTQGSVRLWRASGCGEHNFFEMSATLEAKAQSDNPNSPDRLFRSSGPAISGSPRISMRARPRSPNASCFIQA